MSSDATGSCVMHVNISAVHLAPVEPYGKIATLFKSADNLRAAGVWTVDSGQRFSYELPYDLFIYVVEGELHVALQDGRRIMLTKGDTAYFTEGQATEWTAHADSRAVFCCISETEKIDF